VSEKQAGKTNIKWKLQDFMVACCAVVKTNDKKGLFIITGVVLVIIVFCIQNNNSDVKLIRLNSKMHEARANHKSSILCDGNVLITGGYKNAAYVFPEGLKSTEIYNVKAKKFIKGPDMNLTHFHHSQFTLPNCEVLVADANGIETYDPQQNKFTLWDKKILPRGNERYDYQDNYRYINYALLDNGNVLATGGEKYTTREITTIRGEKQERNVVRTLPYAEILDTKNKKVVRINDMPQSRSRHTSYKDKDGKVYIMYGTTASFLYFDTKTNTFKEFVKYINDGRELDISVYPSEKEDEVIILSASYWGGAPNEIDFIGRFNFKTKDFVRLEPRPKYKLYSKNTSFQDGNYKIYMLNQGYLAIYDPKINELEYRKIRRFNSRLVNVVKINENIALVTGGTVGSTTILLFLNKFNEATKNAYLIRVNKKRRN
jgi:hypothetical protein